MRKKFSGCYRWLPRRLIGGWVSRRGGGEKKVWGNIWRGPGNALSLPPLPTRTRGAVEGGGSGGSLRQCSEKKEEQKVIRSVAGAKDTIGSARRRRPAISTMESLILAQDER